MVEHEAQKVDAASVSVAAVFRYREYLLIPFYGEV